MLNITSGRIARPQKLVFYGSEGIGKTSLAAQCPDPLFIDTEGGTAHLDVRRTQKPQDWDELITLVREIAATPDVCRTLVIDTADWAESMCIEYICRKYNQPGIESFGYGKGYSYLAEEFSRLLLACNEVILSGKNVVITAHAKMRKQELPDEQGAFDRWELKLSKQTAPLLKEWPDALLFLNFKTYVVATEGNGTQKTVIICRRKWICALPALLLSLNRCLHRKSRCRKRTRWSRRRHPSPKGNLCRQ